MFDIDFICFMFYFIKLFDCFVIVSVVFDFFNWLKDDYFKVIC
jgi:hypothetical protein